MCIRDSLKTDRLLLRRLVPDDLDALYALYCDPEMRRYFPCLLYTSDAADERSSVDLGGRRLIKKKKNTTYRTAGTIHPNVHNK